MVKKFFVLLFFIFASVNCIADGLDYFYKSLTNIFYYDVIGYLEISDGKISDRPPLIISASGYNYIYPYNSFIKIFDKYTGDEYYTRNLNDVTGYFTRILLDTDAQGNYISDDWIFIPGPDERLSISMKDYSNANRIYIEPRGSDYYFVIARFPPDGFHPHMIGNEYDDNCDDEVVIIDEFKINFYKPTGRIHKSSNGIYFTFDKAEETQGDIFFDFVNLSNIDILSDINTVKTFIENNDIDFLNLKNSREYYLEMLNEAYRRVENNNVISLFSPYDPFEIKGILYELLLLLDIYL
jgi:hypothetical protein